MEEVEEANKAAVESCHRLLSLVSQPKDQNQYRNLVVETGEAVCKFKKVVSLLNSTLGHARIRKFKKIQTPFPQNILLENSISRNDSDHPQQPPAPAAPAPAPKTALQLLQINSLDNHHHPLQDLGSNVKSALTLGNPSLELGSSHGKSTLQLAQQTPLPPNYQFLHQQQQQQQRYQIQQQQQQQQLKQQAEMMYRRSNSGISLNFDSSVCTPTMSSTRSFISSLSIDGSVANLDGNAFHLIGGSRSADQSSFQHKRRCSGRGEDGSVKCGSSGRCHCSKKRCLFFS